MIEEERRKHEIQLELAQEFDGFFFNVAVPCPYGFPYEAIYHQAIFSRLNATSISSLLTYGYRRNGNCIYDMHCPECQLCVPIRLQPERFQANRNQRRVWKKNQDVTVELASLTMSKENLILLQRFLNTRFPEGQSRAESYYNSFFITSIIPCFEIRYRVDNHLIGVAIVDGGHEWLNAVYFFFDPDQAWRSPGILNILTLIHLCRSRKLKYLYLGYWIKGLSAMNYKSAFYPHELFLNGKWKECSKECKKSP